MDVKFGETNHPSTNMARGRERKRCVDLAVDIGATVREQGGVRGIGGRLTRRNACVRQMRPLAKGRAVEV